MIKIKTEILDLIVSHCQEEKPLEACGILAGRERNKNGLTIKEVLKAYRCTNELKSSTEYQIPAQEQYTIFKEIDDLSLHLLGFYHSHPSTSSRPSCLDEERATYHGYSYLIVALDPLHASSWVSERSGKFKEEEMCIQ